MWLSCVGDLRQWGFQHDVRHSFKHAEVPSLPVGWHVWSTRRMCAPCFL